MGSRIVALAVLSTLLTLNFGVLPRAGAEPITASGWELKSPHFPIFDLNDIACPTRRNCYAVV